MQRARLPGQRMGRHHGHHPSPQDGLYVRHAHHHRAGGKQNPDGAAGVCQLGQAAAGEGQHGLRALPHALRQGLHPRRLLQQVSSASAAARVRGTAELDQGELGRSAHCLWRRFTPLSSPTQLRHITANGLVPLATAEQLEGLAACMQTRCAHSNAHAACAHSSPPSTAFAS